MTDGHHLYQLFSCSGWGQLATSGFAGAFSNQAEIVRIIVFGCLSLAGMRASSAFAIVLASFGNAVAFIFASSGSIISVSSCSNASSKNTGQSSGKGVPYS